SGVCAAANSASVKITVNPKSTNPTSATATALTICNGQSTALSLVGGGGGANETIRWFTGSCGGTLVGGGNALSVSPAVTTTYFGRYEDAAPCNFNTTCASVTITVNPLTVGGNVASAQTICSGSTPANLTLSGQTGSVVKWQRSSDAA